MDTILGYGIWPEFYDSFGPEVEWTLPLANARRPPLPKPSQYRVLLGPSVARLMLNGVSIPSPSRTYCLGTEALKGPLRAYYLGT